MDQPAVAAAELDSPVAYHIRLASHEDGSLTIVIINKDGQQMPLDGRETMEQVVGAAAQVMLACADRLDAIDGRKKRQAAMIMVTSEGGNPGVFYRPESTRMSRIESLQSLGDEVDNRIEALYEEIEQSLADSLASAVQTIN